MNFSEKMQRLDCILEKMEKNALPMEETLLLYDEGQKLLAECREFLTNAEGKIALLSENGDKKTFTASKE